MAFIEGRSYTIGVDSDAELETFNTRTVAERSHLTEQEVYAAWDASRKRLKAALNSLPDDRLAVRFPFPWGGAGSISDMIKGLAQHEQEHMQEVQARASQL